MWIQVTHRDEELLFRKLTKAEENEPMKDIAFRAVQDEVCDGMIQIDPESAENHAHLADFCVTFYSRKTDKLGVVCFSRIGFYPQEENPSPA